VVTRRPHVSVLVAEASDRQAFVSPFGATVPSGPSWLTPGPAGVEIERRQSGVGEWTQRQGPSFEVVPVAPPPQRRKPA
jgi:hypothetical protein